MDEIEQVVLTLSKNGKEDNTVFIDMLEAVFGKRIPHDKRGQFFGYVGNILLNYSHFNLALASLNHALEYFQVYDDTYQEAGTYHNLGVTYQSMGNFSKAIEYLEKALEIMKQLNYAYNVGACLVDLSSTYGKLGNFPKAMEYSEKALEIMKEVRDRRGEAMCYVNLGNSHGRMNNFSKAIEYLEKALEIMKEVRDRRGEAMCCLNLGLTYLNWGKFTNSFYVHSTTYLENALKLAKELYDESLEAACYANLGLAQSNLVDFAAASCIGEEKDFSVAAKYFEEALTIAKKIGDLDLERISNFNLGTICDESNDPEAAYSYYSRSIELGEATAGKLIEEENKLANYAQASTVYKYMVNLCLRLRSEKEAFDYIERSKSRAFLEILSTTEIRPRSALTEELRVLIEDEKKYLAKLQNIQTRHLTNPSATVGVGEMDQILDTLQKIYFMIAKIDPEYAFLRKGVPYSVDKIREMLPPDSVLIEYFVTGQNISIAVVTNSGLHIKQLDLLERRLELYVDSYRRELADFFQEESISVAGAELSKYLVQPIAEFLSNVNLIYFVPYGHLHYIPLHALELDGTALIKNHVVTYLPSASVLAFTKNKGSDAFNSCASFGIEFKEEAEAVARLFGTTSYPDATKVIILGNIDKDVLHFSCHGKFDENNPLLSGIELHDDILTANEIFKLKLDSELITLSACQTGINKIKPGDELIGLTRALLYAGTPSVIVSLWSVNAECTKELMIEFYMQLRNGKDKATALQKAQKKIMEKKEYSHPYYWAPFILIGDWE
jgi:CHAT domain-containing protein/Tfp pilus assembly protein PilF